MATLTMPVPSGAAPFAPIPISPAASLPTKRWTCQQFHNANEMGLFEGTRPILINGEILEQGIMNPPHALSLPDAHEALRAVFHPAFHIRNQAPLMLSLWTDPMPDFAVIPGRSKDLKGKHPTSAALVLEISDSTLGMDLGTKVELYATACIADYWVLDVTARKLHVFRQPDKGQYISETILNESDSIAPLALPASQVKVADLLP